VNQLFLLTLTASINGSPEVRLFVPRTSAEADKIAATARRNGYEQVLRTPVEILGRSS
jgi:hypothetical protein